MRRQSARRRRKQNAKSSDFSPKSDVTKKPKIHALENCKNGNAIAVEDAVGSNADTKSEDSDVSARIKGDLCTSRSTNAEKRSADFFTLTNASSKKTKAAGLKQRPRTPDQAQRVKII